MKKLAFVSLFSLAAAAASALELPRIAAFELDGRFSQAKWAGAMSVAFTNREATAYLALCGDDIVIGVNSRHGRLSAKVCNYDEHDKPVYDNDSMEVFIGVPGRPGFWHVIANVMGTIYDEYNDPNRRVTLGWDSGARAAGSYDENGDSYYIETRLPVAAYTPVEGKISLAVCSYTRWNMNGRSVMGQYFLPDTWTVVDLGEPFPVVLEKMDVPGLSGVQPCSFTISNRSDKPRKLVGTFAGSPVEWEIGAGDTRTFESFNRMKKDEVVEVALKLDCDGRRVLEAFRNIKAKPLLKAIPVSDIIWEGEPLKLKVTVFEKQTEPVTVEVLPGGAKCIYKGEEVVVPYVTDKSPWGK